jgi:threonine aldolase
VSTAAAKHRHRHQRIINLYSDTQTMPTAEMLAAMASAKLGDDTHGSDPTVNALEEVVAQRLGQEAAMLVLSGTMANLVALMTHCQPGDEVYLDRDVHVLIAEAGGMSSVAGVVPTVVPSIRGHLTPDALTSRIQPPHLIRARPRLVWHENTHNLAGGTVQTLQAQVQLAEVATQHGLKSHLDGARLPNAAAVTGYSWAEMTQGMDSVYLDFTKGLACPVGAVLAGSGEFIEAARRRRRVLGGGMRQAGVIAACALVALDTHADQAHRDHQRAQLLGHLLESSEHYRLASPTETNMVVVDVQALGTSEEVAAMLRVHGVAASVRPPHNLRLVTHHDVEEADVVEAVQRMESAARALVRLPGRSRGQARPGSARPDQGTAFDDMSKGSKRADSDA